VTTVIETTDFHVRQFDGDGGYCDSKNCAAATAAEDVYRSTGDRLNADQVRAESHVSCTPGVTSPSGGLRISDIERVVAAHGGNIDFGWHDATGYTRWAPATLALRAGQGWGAHLLIDYGYLRDPWRAPGSSFTGDHSTYAHDFRASDSTYCWHDPLRKTGIRIPAAELVRTWWPASGSLRGYAGMVRQQAVVVPPPVDASGGTDVAIRYSPAIASPTSRMHLAAGQRLYDSPGGDPVTKMASSGAPPHIGLTRSRGGKPWRAVQVSTQWSYSDGKAHRTVLFVPATAGKVVNG
jgi:hypothetical protein